MSRAIISGSAGVAVLTHGGALFSIDIDRLDDLMPCQPRDVAYLFGDVRDQQIVERADSETVKRMLDQAWRGAEGLQLALILLDGEMDDETRALAAGELNEALAARDTLDHVEAVLSSRPLPASVSLAGALSLVVATKMDATRALLVRLQARQAVIGEVWEAFEAVPTRLFGDDDADRARAQAALVREGVFRELVGAREAGKNMGGAAAAVLVQPGVQALRNHQEILEAWIAPLGEGEAQRSEVGEPTASGDKNQSVTLPGIVDLLKEKVKENVASQKQAVANAIARGDSAKARALAEDLVTFQLQNGDPIYAVKSLCNLAMDAQRCGSYLLQVDLLKRAAGLKEDDGWTWAQLGKALLNVRRYAEALPAYDNALACGSGVIAKTGRAEVLKAMGRPVEALLAYDAILMVHPENVFAKTGRAEVLKVLGRHDDALQAYDAALASHPEDVFAKTGRAEVLKVLGRHDDALQAYDAALANHPENMVAKNGRAEILKALGRLDDALRAYGAALASHPENVVAKSGRAEVLKALGRHADALQAYDAALASHPEDVVAKNGRAEVLKVLGRLDDALLAYDVVRRQHPENQVARNGRAVVLAALGRWQEALQHLPESPTGQHDWVAYHIRGMIFLRTGNLRAAEDIFAHGFQHNPFAVDRDYFRTALAVVRLRRRELGSVLALLTEVRLPALQAPANVLFTHALALQGEATRAAEAFARIPSQGTPLLLDIREELRRRLGHEPPRYDDDRLIDLELDLLDQAA